MESEILKVVAEYGLLAIFISVVGWYFIKALNRKDEQLINVMDRSITAIENNTTALSELKEEIRK